MFDFLKKFLKTSNEAEIKRIRRTVDQINAMEDGIKKLSDRSFAAKSAVSSLTALCSAALLLLSSIMLVDATTNPFLYFRF